MSYVSQILWSRICFGRPSEQAIDCERRQSSLPLLHLSHKCSLPGASKGPPGDTKCVTKIVEGDKNKEVKGREKSTCLL